MNTESMNIERVFDVVNYQLRKYPQSKALNLFSNGAWRSISTEQLLQKVDAMSLWLLDNGFKKNDKVVIIPRMGRPDWMVIDFACQQIGVVVVPIHPTNSESELEYIFNQTSPKLCIAADEGLHFKTKHIIEQLDMDCHVHHIEAEIPGYFKPLKLISPDRDVDKLTTIRGKISGDDMLTIMYTSGTTGQPKGAMLTHNNVASNILSILAVFPLEPGQRVLSFLPFSHILERTACYVYLAYGVSLYFGHDRESFSHDFKTVKPHFCTMVPRVLEKMYDYLEEQMITKNWVKRQILKKAIAIGENYKDPRQLTLWFRLKLFFARIFVLNHWRKKLGGRIKYMAVGAAALRPEIGRLFSAAKVGIREGYGMTETSPLISLNRFDSGLNRFGTVGITVPGVEVRISGSDESGEGEIEVKGPNVMKGYYKQAKFTKEAFTEDGWLKTGDIGLFDDKFLKITDRKKDIFKTSAGKYIAPQPLEAHFTSSPFIQQCMIIGFRQPFVTALIAPQFSMLEKWCIQEGIHWTAPQYMVHNVKVRARLEQDVDSLNEALPNYKRVRNFVLCHEEWTSENGEMTSSFKIIRKVVENHHLKEIENMYNKIN